MIVRNDNTNMPADNSDEKARIWIKKGILTVACIAAACACGVSFYQYQQGAAKREVEKQMLIDEINSLETPSFSMAIQGLNPDVAADMASLAMSVAQLQNRYFSDDDMLEVQVALRDCFSDSSGELKWYYPGSSTKGLSWRYNVGSGQESGAENAIWTLTDGEGNICAYVKSGYDKETGKFGKVECHVTTHGYELSSAVEVEPEGPDDYDEYYDFIADPEGRMKSEVNDDEEK